MQVRIVPWIVALDVIIDVNSLVWTAPIQTMVCLIILLVQVGINISFGLISEGLLYALSARPFGPGRFLPVPDHNTAARARYVFPIPYWKEVTQVDG